MHPIQIKLLKLAQGNMRLYSSISAELCQFLVKDFEVARKVNDDGVFELARGLNNYSANTARIRGLLLALCKNNIDKCEALFKEIHNAIIKKGKYGKSARLQEENVLALAKALMPFEGKQGLTNTATAAPIGLGQLHKMLQKDMPELASALFSKPGIDLKHQTTK